MYAHTSVQSHSVESVNPVIKRLPRNIPLNPTPSREIVTFVRNPRLHFTMATPAPRKDISESSLSLANKRMRQLTLPQIGPISASGSTSP
jgi:hypothetical protein